jgi:hypothetical protein
VVIKTYLGKKERSIEKHKNLFNEITEGAADEFLNSENLLFYCSLIYNFCIFSRVASQ